MGHAMRTCLVMDPSGELQGMATESLGRLGMACDVTRHPEAFAVRKAYDVVLMDMRPYVNFSDAFRRVLRDVGQAHVIGFIAPRDAVDRVLALEMGADAIIVPPFGPEEIGVRVRALLRRAAQARAADAVVLRACLDVGARTVALANVRGLPALRLSANEALVLQQLASRPGQVMSRAELLGRSGLARLGHPVQTVELLVSRLRHKFRSKWQVGASSASSSAPATGLSGDPIRTVRGQGYAWCASVLQLAVCAADAVGADTVEEDATA